jgi:phosphomannomutase
VSFSTVSIEHGQMMMECSSLAQVFILTNKKSEIEERYWQRLTELFSKNEKLKSCIAVCDTSEGVSGTIVDEFGVSMGY